MHSRALERFAPGGCPPGWTEAAIGEALREVADPIEMRDDEEYALVSIRRRHGGMFHRERLLGRQVLTKSLQWVIPGTFVIARMQIVHGACALAPAEFRSCAISKSYSSFASTAMCDAKYFSLLAQQEFMTEYFRDSSQGVVIEKMTFQQSRWLDYRVYLPPLEEQRRIAIVLETIDEAIQATERVIAKRRQLSRAVVDQALSQWRSFVRPLEGLCRSLTVGVVSSATYAYVTDGVPFVRSQNVRPGRIETSDMLKVTPAFVEQHRSTRLELGDVLIVRTGYPGTAAAVTADVVGGSCFSLLVARPDRSVLDPNFLVAYLNSEAAKRQVASMQFGSAQHNLNAGQVRSLQVPCPTISDQQALVRLQEEASATVSTELALLAKLRECRAGLAADLLSGRVRTVAA